MPTKSCSTGWPGRKLCRSKVEGVPQPEGLEGNGFVVVERINERQECLPMTKTSAHLVFLLSVVTTIIGQLLLEKRR
jgi:hypothetical protein